MRVLVLGSGEGWHAEQLSQACRRREFAIQFAGYESLAGHVHPGNRSGSVGTERGTIGDKDIVLTRTMPAGSFELICFRLACLHDLIRQGIPVINPPAGLELAIDKFATLRIAEQLGIHVPETRVVQDRRSAWNAFDELGGDCVVKPIFGGEGRGVMRIAHRELAWTVFSTLQTADQVMYVQRFVPPGGRDRRILLIGDDAFGIRRVRHDDFRTNTRGQVAAGNQGSTHAFVPDGDRLDASRKLADALGLSIAAVDWIEDESGKDVLLEVNAIPGWKSAQAVIDVNLADRMISVLEAA